MRLEWNGAELLTRVTEAARVSIDETLREADADASSSHFWVNRTGNLQGQIVTEAAKVEGFRVSGRFGTTERRGFYGLFHEEGTMREHATPFLRPAGDRTFPTLAAKIRARLG